MSWLHRQMECGIDWALGDSPVQRRDLGEVSLLELVMTLAAAPHPCPETFSCLVSFFLPPHYSADLGKQISPLMSFRTTTWFS